MLTNLSVQNFALISKLELPFQKGFSVFTGETGSGKSILLGALNLILGERADFSVIRDPNKKTVVEATFNISVYFLKDFFIENDLDFSEETLIRREISTNGKSRAFVNDSPVQLTVLKSLAENLIHIHSQHHTLDLRNEKFQLDFLDYLAGTFELRNEFQKLYIDFKHVQQELNAIKKSYEDSLKEEDYINFQVEELSNLNLEKINFESLEEEYRQLENVDQIKESFFSVSEALSGERQVLEQLIRLTSLLDKNSDLHPELNSFLSRIKSCSLDLKDIALESEALVDSLEENPKRKSEIENILSKYNSLLIKHSVKSQSELIGIYEGFKLKEQKGDQLKNQIIKLEKEEKELQLVLLQKGDDLHNKRLKSAPTISESLTSILADLKMIGTQVVFDLEKLDQARPDGFSKLSLKFSPNKGLEPKLIEKVASGGELSRLMLAIQLLLSQKKKLPSLIFDEIDTGVSGDVAQKIGELLSKMGTSMQVMAITHLPQVAAKGKTHYKVSKSEKDNLTETDVLILNAEEQILEVARLMSGENINEAAIQNAKELMD